MYALRFLFYLRFFLLAGSQVYICRNSFFYFQIVAASHQLKQLSLMKSHIHNALAILKVFILNMHNLQIHYCIAILL